MDKNVVIHGSLPGSRLSTVDGQRITRPDTGFDVNYSPMDILLYWWVCQMVSTEVCDKTINVRVAGVIVVKSKSFGMAESRTVSEKKSDT